MLAVSCTLNKRFVKRNEASFIKVADYVIKNDIRKSNTEQITDTSVKDLLRTLKVDAVSLGNHYSHNQYEPKDSVVVFFKNGLYIFGKHKWVFYVYSTLPYDYPDTSIRGRVNSKFEHVTGKFYLTTQTTAR
jgi:hypothetical protein